MTPESADLTQEPNGTDDDLLGAVKPGVRATVGFLRAAALLVLAVYAISSVTGLGRHWMSGSGSHWVSGGLLVIAAVLCLLRALVVSVQRSVWVVVGLGLLSWASGEILIAGTATPGGHGFALGDILSLAFYPAAFITLILLLRTRLEQFFTTLWLDGLAGALSVCALAATFLLPPVLANHRGAKLVDLLGTMTYPLADLLLVAGVVFALAMTGWRPGAFLGAIACAFVLVASTDAFSLWWSSTGHSVGSVQWYWLWPASALLVAESAWRACAPVPVVSSTSLRLLIVPLTF